MNSYEPMRVTPSNWKKFRDIRIRAVSDSPLAFGVSIFDTLSKTEDSWKAWITDPYVYAIEDDDRYIATATLRLDSEDNVWCINGVWTDQSYRKKGLSKKLFETIFEKARSLSIEFLELSVADSQEAAIKLYETLGFEIIKTNTDVLMLDDKKHSEYIMRKYL